MKKFKVISIHYTRDCNLNCKCCYRQFQDSDKTKPFKFFIDLIPHLKQLTNQIALGGGEPFYHPDFIKDFSKECKKNKIILNITTNGKLLINKSDEELKELLKNITMISISFDKYKIKNINDFTDYIKLVKKLKRISKIQIGTNLLIDKYLFENDKLIKLCDLLFGIGIDRIFVLYPKYVEGIDILKYKQDYNYLTLKYEHFYVDDLTKMIFEEGYNGWKHSCHYGKDLISIDEKGYVYGCSFDTKEILRINKPNDILKMMNIKFKERFECPYLNIKEEEIQNVIPKL